MEEQKKQDVASHSLESEFVTYEQAVALKELGLNDKCIATIENNGYVHIKGTRGLPSAAAVVNKVDAPLKQQALRFLYEKSSLACRVAKNDSSDHKYYYSIAGPTYASYFDAVSFIDAESKLIDALIDIVKKGGMPPISDLKDDQEEGLTKIKNKMEELSFDQLIINVHDWANDKGLIDPSFVKSQMIKVLEELGETASAISKNKPDELIDGLGDTFVTLIILTMQCGLTPQEALNSAWNEIKDRKGKTTNGVFIKQ